MSVHFRITQTAQTYIKLAIKWLSKTSNAENSREEIKGLISDFKNQVSLFPGSGKPCQYFNIDNYREIVKGNYRFIYKVETTKEEDQTITLIMFCHTRMDYQTLLSHTPELIN